MDTETKDGRKSETPSPPPMDRLVHLPRSACRPSIPRFVIGRPVRARMASDWRVSVVTDSAGLRLRLRHQFGERGMSFGSIRERKLLSQEALAEQSGLSLRTIQRLEAGHRVSYASLRTLAAALQMDVE